LPDQRHKRVGPHVVSVEKRTWLSHLAGEWYAFVPIDEPVAVTDLMRRAFVALVLGVMAMAAAMRAESLPTLIVRLYNTAGIPAPELLVARRTAEQILRDTDLNVLFRHCGRPVPGEPVDRCEESLKPFEVVVRVMHAPAFNSTLHADAYGVTYVVQETNRGWLATVFSDRIAHAAARVGVERGPLLGRVMAHEVGHLLLGVGYHGESGLMRAEWPDSRLSGSHDDWRFSMSEASSIHRVLAPVGRVPLAVIPPLHF
jgi:hypothetical protein